MKQLSESQKKYLKGLGHSIKPVVMIGGHGLKDSIIKEIEAALEYHELIKVKIAGAEREEKKSYIEKIVEETNSTAVQQIGGMVLLFRRNTKKPKVELPK